MADSQFEDGVERPPSVPRATAWSQTTRDLRAGQGLDFGDEAFAYVRRFAYRHAGISISEAKRSMVRRRIARRMSALSIHTPEDYCRYLESAAGQGELQPLINVLTTNKTSFFREADHFVHLRDSVIPRLLKAGAEREGPRVRVWSAGCSTGEEAWSIAMTVASVLGTAATPAQVEILATDIDTNVLAEARAATYSEESIAEIPVALRRRFLIRRGTEYQITPQLKSLVRFQHLNLHETWPHNWTFDAIFCRNVVIYFDKPSQRRLIERFAGRLAEGGYFYSGHAECLYGLCESLVFSGRSIYRRMA